MNTQIIFNIQPDLKKKVQKRAAAEGIALGTVLKLATQAYADGILNVTLAQRGMPIFEPTQSDIAELAQARKDHKAGAFSLWSDLKHDLDHPYRHKSR